MYSNRKYKVIQINTTDDLERFCTFPSSTALTPDILTRHRANSHWMLVDGASNIVGRCSTWWESTPPYPDHHLGLIGHYAAYRYEAATQLLTIACNQLAAKGCTMAVGPMDGNTWRNYRLITEWGSEPIFFLEPDNHNEWPDHFTNSDFSPLTYYFSALNTSLNQQDPRASRVAERIADQDIQIRFIDLDCFVDELRRIYSVVVVSFSNNFLFAPISESEFISQYLPLKLYIRPELVLMVEFQESLIGFLFAIPDILQAKRGRIIDTVIIKTLAVLPEFERIGLGALLTTRCHEIARNLGYTQAIHALIHETNIVRNTSSRYAKPIRHYTLYAKGF